MAAFQGAFRGRMSSALCLLAATPALGDTLGPNTQVLLRSGSGLVDFPPNRTISYISWFSVAPNGALALDLEVGGSSTDNGVFQMQSGVPRLVALSGTQAPGAAPGQLFQGFYTPTQAVVTDGAYASTRGELFGPGVTSANSSGVWANSGAGLSLLARSGNPAPEAGAAATFGPFSLLHAGSTGSLVTSSALSDPARPLSIDSAIWKFQGGTRTIIARAGDTAPGTGGETFDKLVEDTVNNPPTTTITTTPNGATVFGGRIVKDGVSHPSLWSHTDAGGLRLVAESGQTGFVNLPGVTLGVNERLSASDAGFVAFRSDLSKNVTPDNNTAVVLADTRGPASPTLKIVARKGDPVPGRPWHFAPSSSGNQFRDPQVNSSGHVLFSSFLDMPSFGSGGSGMFLYDGASVRTLSISGDPITDRPGGNKLSVMFGVTASNEYDDIAFLSASIGFSGISGLFVHIGGGPLHTIAMRNDRVQVSPGVFKTIDQFTYGSNDFPTPTPTWDGNRNLYYNVKFTDGSYALLSTHVPEPSVVSALFGLALLSPRRRGRVN